MLGTCLTHSYRLGNGREEEELRTGFITDMTSASHGKAKRRVRLCAAERTAKRRKSSSGRKNKPRTSGTTPASSSCSPPAAVPGRRHPRPPPAPPPAPSPPLLRHLPDAVTLALGLLPPRAGEPRQLPQPGPAAPLPTTAGPNSWRGPVAQNRGRTARPPRPGPEAAGGRREGACQSCPSLPAAPDTSYLGRRGGRRGHQHGASATSAA